MLAPIIILLIVIMIFNAFGSDGGKKESKPKANYEDIKRACPECYGLGARPVCSECSSTALEEPSSEYHEGNMYCYQCEKIGNTNYRIDPEYCECCKGTGKITDDELYDFYDR